jgi:Uma2 family endonuclease
MATMTQPAVQHLVLDNVDWPTYTRFLHIFAERPSFRLAYDRAVLEIVSPPFEHDVDARFLGRLVVTLTEELGLPILCGGSTTFRRRRRRRGIEADESYWIAHEPQVRGRRRINLRVDPPPDLAIEVDVTRSSINRMGIYAALGVPEVWRLNAQVLRFLVLGPNRRYTEATHSLSFPLVTPADLMSFLAMRGPLLGTNAIIAQFRAWVQQRLAGGEGAP